MPALIGWLKLKQVFQPHGILSSVYECVLADSNANTIDLT